MSNLIRAEELGLQLHDPDLIVIDTRFSLQDPDKGRRLFQQGHIPGAAYFDLDRDLAAPPQEQGGRHPLPDLDTFVAKLERAGVGSSSQVVVYDHSGGMFAGRTWWLLKYLGHDGVQVLDGGLSAWQEAGLPLATDVPEKAPGRFTVNLRPEMALSMAEVRSKLNNPTTLLIDARAPERYRGEVEPLDKKAGHIPGAVNKPFTENLAAGKFRDASELKARFKEAEGAQEVIVYCGSGVSAAHDLLALEEAGIAGAKLYVGSWSDWSSFDENPVARGDEG